MKPRSLRAWLRREPVPDKVKVRLTDGEERDIHIPADIRNRWKTVEASILASDAVAVDLFDKKGTVLRGQALEREEAEDESDTPEAKADKARTKTMHEWTGMLQAVMAEQNKSFEKGVAAAAQSQDSLTDLVDSMAGHFATALTNIHNIVANMAIMQQQHAEQTAKLTAKIADLSSAGGDAASDDASLKQMAIAMLSGGMGGMVPPSNGKPEAAAAPARKTAKG